MGAWYESLYSQLRWKHYTELMKIVQPSAEDWRNLSVVRANAKASGKLAPRRFKHQGETGGIMNLKQELDKQIRIILEVYRAQSEISQEMVGEPSLVALEEAIASLLAKIEQHVLEARRDQIHKDLGGYGYTMPIKSVRTRNTAFKLYAVKFFNGTIRKRRERQLAELDALLNTKEDTK